MECQRVQNPRVAEPPHAAGLRLQQREGKDTTRNWETGEEGGDNRLNESLFDKSLS